VHGTRIDVPTLNYQLLPGPDLENSLVGILFRFRKESVAITYDVEATSHQIDVPTNQCNFPRFMWWPNDDLDTAFLEYQMTVYLSVALPSPSIYNFARMILDDNDLGLPINNTIQRTFYVYDCLKSVDQEESAIRLVNELCYACRVGGFNIVIAVKLWNPFLNLIVQR